MGSERATELHGDAVVISEEVFCIGKFTHFVISLMATKKKKQTTKNFELIFFLISRT